MGYDQGYCKDKDDRGRLAAWLVVLLWLALPAIGQAQPEVAQWFGPTLGKAKPHIIVEETVQGDREVQGQNQDWRTAEHGVRFGIPLFQDEGREWTATAQIAAKESKTEAVLPTTGEPIPQTLWDLRFASAYRRRLDNGWIGGISAGIESASDKPFHSLRETGLQGTVFARRLDGERNGWLFLVHYDSQREFLPHVPLPGIGYWYEPHDRFLAVFGIPFAFVFARPTADVTFEVAYLPITNVHAGVGWRLHERLSLRATFDWERESYQRAEQPDKEKRLFLYEKKLALGFRWRFLDRHSLDFSGGYAFDRMLFEGEKYSDRDFNRIDIDPGPFVSGQVTLVF